MDIITSSSNPNSSSQKLDSNIPFRNDPSLNLSQNSKEKSDECDNHEEILSKDTDTNDDMTRLEERESPSPSLPSKRNKKISKTISLSDYEQTASIAIDRKRRTSKKPTNNYEEKMEEEKEKLQKKQRAPSKKKAPPKVESIQEDKMEIENPRELSRHEIGYEWKDLHLAFREGLASLSQEEFITFIKMVAKDKPECVSFDKGYLELKITGGKVEPSISNDEYTKTNQMLVQNGTYRELLEYIAKIKGNNTMEKSKGKRNPRK